MGLRLTKGSVSELNEYLLDGRAHIIISNHFEMKSYPMFHYERVVQTTPCVYVSRENPLSKKSVLEADDLKGERLLCSCCADQSGYSAAAGALAAAGIPYQPDSLVNNEEAIMSMVEAGLGCYPAAALFSRMIPNNVACIPLNLKVDNMEIVVAYLSPEVSEFALHIREIAQKIFEG